MQTEPSQEAVTDLRPFALEALRVRITSVFPAQIRSCIEQLTEEQIWWRPNPGSNSVGNLVLHVCGAVMHFLCHRVGGLDYQRDRPVEFATEAMPKSQLLEVFDEMVQDATRTFQDLSLSRLSDPSTEPAYYSTVLEDLIGVGFHVASHAGQIVYITKMLHEGSVNELWSHTHRTSGAWRMGAASAK